MYFRRHRKIITFAVITVFLLFLAYLYINNNSKAQEQLARFFPKVTKTATLKLDTESPKVKVGEQFRVSLILINKTGGVSSFDAIIIYDPDFVRVDEIKTSDIFPFYPRKLVEDYKNRFIITGVQNNPNPLNIRSGEVAVVLVTPLKSGNTGFDFLVDGEKYSNVLNGKLENVLAGTEGVKVEIGE